MPVKHHQKGHKTRRFPLFARGLHTKTAFCKKIKTTQQVLPYKQTKITNKRNKFTKGRTASLIKRIIVSNCKKITPSPPRENYWQISLEYMTKLSQVPSKSDRNNGNKKISWQMQSEVISFEDNVSPNYLDQTTRYKFTLD